MPRYDWECPNCRTTIEANTKVDEDLLCRECLVDEGKEVLMKRIITKMPLRTYTKRPQDRLWGTSHLSSSEKFREKQKRKGEKG